MPRTLAVTVTADDGPERFVTNLTVTSDGKVEKSPLVPAAKAGTLTAKTDADTGTATMLTGHGFTTGQKPDVFWAGGSRRGMTATVTGDSVALDGGAGDDLPAAATAVTAMVPQAEEFVVTGDAVRAVVARCPKAGWVTFAEADGTPVAAFRPDGGSDQTWFAGVGAANPLAGAAVGQVLLSHADATGPQPVTAVAYPN